MRIAQENRIKVTENFYLDELIHPDYYDGTNRPLKFLDARIIEALQWLRDKAGVPLFVNNWSQGGTRHFSGLRPMESSIGAKYSQHKFGRAFDIVSAEITPPELHEIILANQGELIQSGRITRMESLEFTNKSGNGWTHIDCAYTGRDQIHVFKP